MKTLLVLAVACFVASPAFSADLKWYGEAGTRYKQQRLDDSLALTSQDNDVSVNKTKQYDLHARLGLTGGKDHVDYGIGLHTSPSAVNSDWVTINQNSDLTFSAELAYLRYSNDFGFGDLSVTVGRQENVFAYDHAGQMIFDNDVRWDGFGWKWKMGNFGLNLSQYIIGSSTKASPYNGSDGSASFTTNAATENNATGSKSFSTMLGFQPHFSFRFTDEIEALFALGYYNWSANGAAGGNLANQAHGFGTLGTSSSAATAVHDTDYTINLNNAHQWQVLADTSLPYNLGFTFEWIKNKKSYYDFVPGTAAQVSAGTYGGGNSREIKNDAYSATLAYGKIAKAGDFKVSYGYGSKGLASSINRYSNSDFVADMKGHTLTGAYGITDSLNLSAKYVTLKEISKKDLAGNEVGNTTTSNKATGQENKWSMWQLVADVAF